MTRLELMPITLAQARAFINEHHRHNEAPVGWSFGDGLVNDIADDTAAVLRWREVRGEPREGEGT